MQKGQLQLTFNVVSNKQNVLWLQVQMDDGLFVQMVEGTQNFTHTRSSLFLRQLPFVVDDCLQFATGCAKEKKIKVH